MNSSASHSNARSRTMTRSLSAAGTFLRQQLWAWPVIAGVILGTIGWFIRGNVEGALKQSLADNLNTILKADVAALKIWLADEERYSQAIVRDAAIQQPIAQLLQLADDPGNTPLEIANTQPAADLKTALDRWLEARNYVGYIVITPQGRFIAADQPTLIGRADLPIPERVQQRLFPTDEQAEPRPVLTRPLRSLIILEDADGQKRQGVPTMFVAAPVVIDGKPVAALGLRIRPDEDFTRILSIARAGESGETYAFDENGLLLSQSRFDDDLKAIGLIPDRAGERSLLTIELRDPQVDMTAGGRPTLRRSEQPLTRMAADAVQGNSGYDVDGYNDYRGVPVVGAWTWLPEYDFGVTTEVDVSEAYRPLYLLRYTFWGLFALLGASAVAIFLFMRRNEKLSRRARQAALEARQLGQYALDDELGRGGMGVVYRGHHSMLQRPTAVKLLHVDKTTPGSIARFEREVRLTSRLTHPNTIAIYDYGRTPEGIFYYAMEYLDGIDLDQLVKQHGAQPEARVIHFLKQICGSLKEAHDVGLIHRDIKPANIFITQRGGMVDFVKVLDFGLVKALDAEAEVSLTAAGALTGTPLYLSPEAVEQPDDVDARSDLYSVGALAYFLLTGKPVFDGKSVIDICMQQVNATPVSPSKRLGQMISPELESIVLGCLAKSPADRPENAAALLASLQQCETATGWSQQQAEEWWSEHQSTGTSEDAAPTPQPTGSNIYDATVIAEAPGEIDASGE